MLTCIACAKPLAGGASLHEPPESDDEFGEVADAGTPSTRPAIKALTAQIKDMAVKATGAYRHCKPCSGGAVPARSTRRIAYADTDGRTPESDQFHHAYSRAGRYCSAASTPRTRTEGLFPAGASSGEATPSMSECSVSEAALTAAGEDEAREWVAQVEPGVLITFLSLPQGGNDLRRIRFSREMFDTWRAQQWWAENYDKVMELYNVSRLDRQAAAADPLLSAAASDENYENGPSSLRWRHHHQYNGRHNSGPATTPKLSSTGSLSESVSEQEEQEWVEEDEPGVYITIRVLPSGIRELRRVRFSRERFSEAQARRWWEVHRARIHELYL